MKKIVIVILALALLTSCTSSPTGSTVYEKDLVQTTYLAKDYPRTHEVSIEGFFAKPDSITIKKGDRITFTNNNGRDHKIQEEMMRTFESPWLKIGESYMHTFNKEGVFTYEILSRHTEFNTQKRKRQGTQRNTARVIIK